MNHEDEIILKQELIRQSLISYLIKTITCFCKNPLANCLIAYRLYYSITLLLLLLRQNSANLAEHIDLHTFTHIL